MLFSLYLCNVELVDGFVCLVDDVTLVVFV